MMKATRLGEMLLEAGLIDRFQLDSALSMQRNLGGRIGSALVKLGYLPEDTIIEFLESQSKFSRVPLADQDIPLELMGLIPANRMLHLLVIPIELRQQGKEKILRIAMTDPTNLKLIDDLQFATGCQVLPVLASEKEIREALQKNLGRERQRHIEPPLETPDSKAGRDTILEHNMLSMDDSQGKSSEPRLDRLLAVLLEKGVLSAQDLDRIKYD